MDKMQHITLMTGLALCLLTVVARYGVNACNEAVCASVVSKCMLTQSCKCELKNCSCCKECSNCLGHLYTECCSCVDLCPKPNETGSSLGKKSHVEDFQDPVVELFNALTHEPDDLKRWTSFTYPIDFDLSAFSPKLEKEIKYRTHNTEQEVNPVKDKLTLNCTVVYHTQCMSWNKCKDTCLSMGSSSYRWFHDGCCECIGNTCINYGINDSRCQGCPASTEDDEALLVEDPSSYTYDYDLNYDEQAKGDAAAQDEENTKV